MTNLRPLVIVLGMHRSGTSLCANLLASLGVDMAEAPGASPANQRGHWERPRINDLHDAVLAIFGRAWADPSHHLGLPDGWWLDKRVKPVRDQLIAWLQPRFSESRLFGFKDPRTARLLAMWPDILAELGATPAYVFCVRNPAQVVRSVAARDGIARAEAEYRWLIYNAHAAHGVGQAPVCVIPYEDWFEAGPEGAARMLGRLADFVRPAGLTNSSDRAAIAATIVDTELRHDSAAEPYRPKPVSRELHRRIVHASPSGALPAALSEWARVILDLEQVATPLMRDVVVLKHGMADQNRVIGDLNGMIRRLQRDNAVLREVPAVHAA